MVLSRSRQDSLEFRLHECRVASARILSHFGSIAIRDEDEGGGARGGGSCTAKGQICGDRSICGTEIKEAALKRPLCSVVFQPGGLTSNLRFQCLPIFKARTVTNGRTLCRRAPTSLSRQLEH